MSNNQTAHEWSKDALFSKAQRFADKMIEADLDDWDSGFWSALTLEMLIRASLANISPVLVAEGKDFNNLLFALGIDPNQNKFTPKSEGVMNLLVRVEKIYPDFTREHLSFCVSHINRRNSELHSGELAFDGLGSSKWIPKFYSSSKVLLEAMGETLNTLLGDDKAEEAEAYILAYQDEGAKEVKGMVNAHRTIWNERSDEEKLKLSEQAETLSTRNYGHRVVCPACSSISLVYGESMGIPKTHIDYEYVVEKQTMLPERFECIACGLKITGYSKLLACDLGDTYTSTTESDIVDYYDIDIEERFRGMLEEDNNE